MNSTARITPPRCSISKQEGFRYSRIANPTTAVLERRVAELEGGVGALAVATGQAALYYAFANVADAGGNIVSTPTLYGTTHTLLQHVLPAPGRQGALRGERVARRHRARDRRRHEGRVLRERRQSGRQYLRSLRRCAEVAHAHGVPLIVDNTVATPILLRPIEHGADIVVHSLTKFMGGHGATLGGAIVDSGRFPWRAHAARFPTFSEPDPPITVSSMSIASARAPLSRARAASISARRGPFWRRSTPFCCLQGLETLALRVERHVENARKVAEFLRDDPRVEWVNYAGFPESPYHELARQYLKGRVPSLLTFGVNGGLEAGKRALRLAAAHQAPRQYRRRQVARLPSRVDDASADVDGRNRRRPASRPRCCG